MTTALVSIAICTRNRADSLRRTLTTLAAVCANHDVEVLVVDNGSTDHTAAVVNEAASRGMPLRVVLEEVPGLARARNRALLESRGSILLFTDDDVDVPEDWITAYRNAFADQRVHAVAGGVQLAPELVPSWMCSTMQMRFASTRGIKDATNRFIGANFAIRRSVLERVPGFDVELGAGALGGSEETLLAMQISKAGFTVAFDNAHPVIHRFDSHRLSRESLLRDARSRGRSSAYLLHHWHHEAPSWIRLRELRKRSQLTLESLLRRRAAVAPASEAELGMVQYIEMLRELRRLDGTPRNYEQGGLIKIRGLIDRRLTALSANSGAGAA